MLLKSNYCFSTATMIFFSAFAYMYTLECVRTCWRVGVCVCALVALIILHANYMRLIIFSFVVWLQHTFTHFPINGKFFEKILLNLKYVLSFSPQHLSKTFFVLRIIQRYVFINVKKSSYCRIFMKFEFSNLIFEKDLNIKFY